MDSNIDERLAESVSDETETEAREEFSYTEYKEVQAMLTQLRDMCDSCRTTIEDTITVGYNLKKEIVDPAGGILYYSINDIKAMSLEDMKIILTEYGSAENTERLIQDSKEDPSEEDIDSCRKILLDIKESQLSIIEGERAYKEGVDEAVEIGKQYREYLSSDIYKKKRDEFIAKLRKSADEETDESKKRKILQKIELYEDTINLEFFKERLDLNTAKEKKSIMRGFFNEEQGRVVMAKYGTRIQKFGFVPDIYGKMFNIEELFLPKEYHVYNNLFLFMYMRYVSYSDPYNERDKARVKALTSSIVSLVYHKFVNQELENEFIEFIKSVDDYFKDEYDKFDADNTTHPNHRNVIEKRKEREAIRKSKIIEQLKTLHVDDYDPEASSDELYELLDQKIEELQAAQAPAHNGETVEVEETGDSDDTQVSISPKVLNDKTEESTKDDETTEVDQ